MMLSESMGIKRRGLLRALVLGSALAFPVHRLWASDEDDESPEFVFKGVGDFSIGFTPEPLYDGQEVQFTIYAPDGTAQSGSGTYRIGKLDSSDVVWRNPKA